ncbi:MAG TPA: penicillin-binding protein 2 [Acidimicrobiales bacterium]|nr:penicillin-binding protein 2 [Acidimicrobiales bacterium]
MALVVVLTLLFVGVLGRLADLQVVSPERYVAYGESQRIRSEVLAADRGSLLDRSGAELALSVPRQTVWADPAAVTDPAAAAARLSPLLGVDTLELRDRLSRGTRFEYLARQVDDDTAERIDALDLAGVHLMVEPLRTYPGGDLASSVLGRADVDQQGVSGIELQLDEALTGEPGEAVFERSLTGLTIPVGERQVRPPTRGDHVELTIDRSLQFVVEDELAARVDEMDARGGTAIVSDPRTGEILAMASVAVDDETGELRPTSHGAGVVDVFSPGSALKLVTVAASLEEGLSSPQRSLVIGDTIEQGGYVFTDHSPHATEPWTVARILSESSNVGTITLARELGAERVWDYLDRFGFGASTGLGFPGESAGLLRPVDEWYGSDLGGAAIGTGVSVTALQLLTAYNTVANDGVHLAPRLVNARIDADGTRHEEPRAEGRRVLSESTSRQVADMLTSVVDAGTGRLAAVPGYQVAGKTGTAWKVLDGGVFADGAGRHQYMATFVGFAPADDPAVSVIVVLDGPRTAYSGGGAAAPAFSRIAQYALRNLDIPPDPALDDAAVTTVSAAAGDRVRAPVTLAPDASDEGQAEGQGDATAAATSSEIAGGGSVDG